MRKIFIILSVLCFGIVISACDSKPKAPAVVKIPDSPVGTVSTVFKALANYRPDVAWAALPKSYQNDINKIVAKSTSLFDKDNYNSYMALIKRFSVAVKQKRKIILNTLMTMAPPGKRKQIEPYIDAIIAVMDEITSSQVMDYDQMLKADVGKFIGLHGSRMMSAFVTANVGAKRKIDELASMKVIEISRIGDKVKLSLHKDGKPVRMPQIFVKVEGRWVPENIQGYWDKQIVTINSSLDKAKSKSADFNVKLRQNFSTIEKFVKNFEEVKNETELAGFSMRIMLLAQKLKSLIR